jgi:hypothetical protein
MGIGLPMLRCLKLAFFNVVLRHDTSAGGDSHCEQSGKDNARTDRRGSQIL